jgi:hypothetical protein
MAPRIIKNSIAMKYLKYLLLLAVIGAAVGFYQYNKPHQNMEKADADVTMTAPELFQAFEKDELSANETYLDKVVEVKGEVQQVSINDEGGISLTLNSGNDMFGVICQLDELTEHQKTTFEPGEEVTVKGICTGMLMDVVLVRCVVKG